MSDRDRKILMGLVPIIVLALYWFVFLTPKREEAAKASEELAQQTERRDAARTAAEAARGAQTDFAADYQEIVRLGKAIPSGVDMPSLMVQLNSAAEGTGIRFTRIATGERDPATTPPPPPPAADGDKPTDAGGEQAQSGAGSAVETANNTAASESQAADAASKTGVDPADTQTSTSTGGGLPIGGGAATPGSPQAAASPALDTVPLEMQFVGNFFNLADFFHDVKRFVRVANNNVLVSGRLITVDDVKLTSDPELFPKLTAELTATVYLSPKAQGATAGATPDGPVPQTTPASAPAASPTPPTATATP